MDGVVTGEREGEILLIDGYRFLLFNITDVALSNSSSNNVFAGVTRLVENTTKASVFGETGKYERIHALDTVEY